MDRLTSRGMQLTVATEAAELLVEWHQHGLGSPEFTNQAVRSSLTVGANYVVPGLGPLAADAGFKIGDALIARTGVDERALEFHPSSDAIRSADDYAQRSDEALRRGDFDEAHRLAERGREEARRAQQQASGVRGVANATGAVPHVDRHLASRALALLNRSGEECSTRPTSCSPSV